MKFKSFLVILEGGNLIIGDKTAGNLYVSDMESEAVYNKYIKGLNGFIDALNKDFQKKNGKPLWVKKKGQLPTSLFAGSTRFLLGKDPKSFEDMKQYKPTVGDMDVQVPEELNTELGEYLNNIKGEDFEGFKFVDFQKSGLQYNCLVEVPDEFKKYFFYQDREQNKLPTNYLQIDFENVVFQDDEPSPFSQFGHYSSWRDLTTGKGVKGVFRAYLMRALASTSFKEVGKPIAVVTPALGLKIGEKGWTGKEKIKATYPDLSLSFAVDKGLRDRYLPVVDADGKLVIVNHDGQDHYLYRETKSSKESVYNQELPMIIDILFGADSDMAKQQDKIKKLHSFSETIPMLVSLSPERQKSIARKIVKYMWDLKSGQEIERNNPKRDEEIKDKAYNIMKSNFDFLGDKENEEVEKLKKVYYSMYSQPAKDKTQKKKEAEELSDLWMYPKKYDDEEE